MKIKNTFLIAAMSSAVLVTGCVTRVVDNSSGPMRSSNTLMYADGRVKCAEPVSVDRARAATLAALKELQFGLVGDVTYATKQIITARTSTDKKVTVVLIKESDSLTQIRVRVGLLGDEVLSLRVLEKIKSHL